MPATDPPSLRFPARPRLALRGVALLSLLCASACTEPAGRWDSTGLDSFRVTFLDPDATGTPDDRLPFPTEPQPVRIRIEALNGDGEPLSDYDGTVYVRAVPGETAAISSWARLSAGVAVDFEVLVSYAFGPTEIWVEEVGVDQEDQCRNGVDDDGNGLIDFPGDPGCFEALDPSEGTASYVTGISDTLWFAPPTIRDVQFNPLDPGGDSPLLEEEVHVTWGALVVSNVVLNGFYVTDLADDAYNSILVYTFGYPEDVALGDRVCEFSGGVQEFVGMTQLNFPSWHIEGQPIADDEELTGARLDCLYESPVPIDLPEPVLLDRDTIASNTALEAFEGSVVAIEGAAVSTSFVNCDQNGDGELSGLLELQCRDECQADLLCTEYSGFDRYGQFGVVVDGERMEIANSERVTGFNPLEGCTGDATTEVGAVCPARTIARAAGTLRHIYLTAAIQLWVIEPRFAADLALAP